MLIFWVVVGVLTAAAAALILMRAASASRTEAVDPAPAVYQRHLAEIDDLAERGLIGAGERQSAHAEAGRRLLAAAEAPSEVWSTAAGTSKGVLVAVAAVPILSLSLYLALGAPGYVDQPYAGRLADWAANDPQALSPPELAAVLRQMNVTKPNDPEGLRMLAMAEGASQNPMAAVRALRRAVALAPQDAGLWRLLGEALVYKAGDKVDAEAQAAFAEALKRDPSDVAARFYLAQGKFQAGQADEAVAELRTVLASMAPDDPRRQVVEAAITNAQAAGGAPRPAPPQMAAIEGMVAGLAARLEANPDDPAGWVQLVRSYAVLGDTAKRDAALAKAQARYARTPDVLGQLSAAARAEPMR